MNHSISVFNALRRPRKLILRGASGLAALALCGAIYGGLGAQSGAGDALSPREAGFLMRCFLEKSDTRWMWDQSSAVLNYRGEARGQYLGGAQDLRWGPAFACLSELTGLPHQPGVTQSIAALAGLPLYAPKQGAQIHSEEINYYNPELIDWTRENMLVAPDTMIAEGLELQQIYNVVFRRNARILAQTYVYLQQEDRMAAYLERYREANGMERREMRDEFEGVSFQDAHGAPANDEWNYNFDPGHAATFWMRRGLDETRDEAWKLLQAVLETYDPAFAGELQ